MAGLVRPLRPRDPAEAHRSVSPLELFTDLCYVVAIAQAALQLHHAVSEDHVRDGIVYFCISFFAVWWGWLNFAWFNSAYDNDDTVHRVLTLAQVLGSLVLAAGVPDVFEGDFTLAVAGYVVMRIGLVLMWLRAGAGHPERRGTAHAYAVGLTGVQVAWLAGVVATGGDLPLWLFLILAGADFVVPMVAERRGATPWHPHHIVERYGLFFIIVLGETILSVTFAIRTAIEGSDPPADLAYVVAGGVLVMFSAWWLYFARDHAEVLTGNDVGYVWGFGHYLIFGAAAAVGAGLAARVDFYDDHSQVSDAVSSAFVTGPVAVLLATLWLVCIRLHDPSWRTGGPVLVAIVAIVALTWVEGTELWVGLAMVALLVAELRPRDRAVVATA